MLIGLAGRKQCGKTTAAEYLRLAHDFNHDSFAGPIRDFTAAILGISLSELEDTKEQPVKWLVGITPRMMMQDIGTMWGRQTVHPDLWVLSLVQRIAPLVNARLPVVVSDVRFPNEADAIHALGGYVVRIDRMGQAPSGDTHASEVGIPDSKIDYEIVNNGESPQHYYAEIDGLVRRLKRRYCA